MNNHTTTEEPVNDQFKHIKIADLHESPTNPRKHFDAKELAELTDSVREHGVVQPIVVRRSKSEVLAYEIVAGARRYRAAKAAGLAEIPAMVRSLTDAQVLEIQIIENLQRADVHPLDEAEGFRAILAANEQYDVAALAVRVGKSESYVYQRIKLCDLIDAVKQALAEDKITVGHAILIARLQPADQIEALAYCLEENWDGVTTVSDLAHWIQNEIHMELARAPFKADDALLLPKAGSCTQCPKRTGYAPALFPELQKKDQCTDRTCFQAKCQAVLDQTKAKYEAKGTPLIEVSNSWGKNKSGALGADKYERAAKGACEHVQPALTIDGPDRGKVIQVCAELGCKVHRPGRAGINSGSTHVDPRAKGRADAALRKQKAAEQAHEQGIRAIVGKVDALTGGDLKDIAKAFAGALWHEKLKEVFKARDWDPAKNTYGQTDYRGTAEERIDAMENGAEVAAFLLELTLRAAGMRGGQDDTVHTIAQRYAVDIDAMEKEILAELNAKAKAKKDKAKKKTAKVKVAGHPNAPRKKKAGRQEGMTA